MVQICIYLLEDIEEELGLENISADGLRKLGQSFNNRINKISDMLKVLEKNKWKWTTGAKDIYLFKDISAKEAEAELKKLKVDKSLLHFD